MTQQGAWTAGGRGGLDVVTLNLWGDNGPVRRRMDDLAAWLRREQPDLVLAQEAEQVDGSDQAELLAGAAGYEHVDAIRTGWGSLAGEGLAVLSRHPLRPLGRARLPLAALDHPRAVQQVDVAAPTGTVRVANTHLAWRLGATPARTNQVRRILAALPGPGQPVVLGGDLNDVPGSEPLAVLAACGFVDCCAAAPSPQVTFDLANAFLWQEELAGRRVDHLLARGLQLADASVVLDGSRPSQGVVSDHYGVRARFGLLR